MYAVKLINKERLTEALIINDETEINCNQVNGPKPLVIPFESKANTLNLEDTRLYLTSAKALHILACDKSYLKSTRNLLLASANLNAVNLRTVFASGNFSAKSGSIKELYINYNGVVDIGDCVVGVLKVMNEHKVKVIRSNSEREMPPVVSCGGRALGRAVAAYRRHAEQQALLAMAE